MSASPPSHAAHSLAGAAVRRSNQAYFDQVCRRETLDCGYAYYNPDHPLVAECNFVGEAVMPPNPSDALSEVEEFYRTRNTTCQRWIPALGQSPGAFEPLLTSLGFVRRETLALIHDPASAGAAGGGGFTATDLRIVEARAMPRAYSAIVTARSQSQSAGPADSLSVLQLERLNDPQYTALVAMLDERPAGMASLLQVGEIGRLCDVFVVADVRGRGVGTALIQYTTRMARRWALRPLCAQISAGATRELRLLERAGFSAGDTITEFARTGPAGAARA